MKKITVSLFAVIAVLILFSSSSLEMVSVVQAQGVDCMDSCTTGCVQRDSRLQSRCERKCQIRCDNNARLQSRCERKCRIRCDNNAFVADLGHD